jgi:hypothetical protein
MGVSVEGEKVPLACGGCKDGINSWMMEIFKQIADTVLIKCRVGLAFD